MIYAVYRCLYGEDFIQESIKSIRDYVDKIFIFWDDRPWGDTESCIYKGEMIKFPKKFDNILDKINELGDPKVNLIYDHVYNNKGQYTHFLNDIILKNWQKPDILMITEVDHVFKQVEISRAMEMMTTGQIQHATTKPLELWKTYEFRISERPRTATIFWDMKGLDFLPDTDRDGSRRLASRFKYILEILPVYTHNFGFCYNPQTMYWKHLTAIAYCKKIGEQRRPNEGWYDKWLNWTVDGENNKDLEITEGREHAISHAYPYEIEELPEVIKDKYNL